MAVYNKEGKLDNEYRTPKLELIAGLDLPETSYKENGIIMGLDVKEVYFC